MKNTIILITLLLTTVCSFAIKVRFTTANMSVNVAEGSIGVFTFFQLYPDNFVPTDSTDFINLIDFPKISYQDIQEVVIEKTTLTTNATPVFIPLKSFILTDSITVGNFADENIIQGNTYAYSLAIIINNQQINLLNNSISTQLGDTRINCAKFNNVYRLAGHNTYQKNIFFNSLFNSLFLTRVLELDAHIPFFTNSYSNDWFVGHFISSYAFGNSNN